MKSQVSSVAIVLALALHFEAGIGMAETIFYDDFQDGDAQDDSPASWASFTSWEGGIDASTGDLVVTKTVDVSPVIAPVGIELADTSIRTQARLEGPVQSVVVGARGSLETDRGYSGGINPDAGGAFIVRIEGPFGTQHTTLGFVPTDLNPQEEDVMLQLDAIGESLRFWAWRAGEPMPAEPLVAVADSELTSGGPYVGWGIGAFENPGPGVFRFVEVATHHIPEPSSMLLACLGIIALLRRLRW